MSAPASPSGSRPTDQAATRPAASRFDPSRGATSFLLAAGKKASAELLAILADPTKLIEAAAYHNIPPDWARFWISEELNYAGRHKSPKKRRK
jgi:hypothetical protein